MVGIKRSGALLIATLIFLMIGLAACGGFGPTPTPTLFLATPTPNIVTLEPTRDPRIGGESILAQDLGPVTGDAHPRLAIDREGGLHMLWLARSATGGSSLLYRHWVEEANWFATETWATWESGGPLQWQLAVDDANIPYAVWSDPGRLFFARRDNPVSRIEFELDFDVAGESVTQNYATCFGFAARANELYVVYRDDSPRPPNFKLARSPYSGKEWEVLETVISDPGMPSRIYDIDLAVGLNGTMHMILDAPDNQVYVQRQPEEENWHGLTMSQDVFEDGELGRHLRLDLNGQPHILLNQRGLVYYYTWNGTAWSGPGQPLLRAEGGKSVMAFDLAPGDIAWVLGDGIPGEEFVNPPEGVWLRTFKGQDTSEAWLLQTGQLTEVNIALSETYAHIISVLDGHLWHLRVPVSLGASLPRNRMEPPPTVEGYGQG